jgi:Flp pilus assembly protein TadB
MWYFGLVLLAFVACFASFAVEIVTGNIAHIRNGREPNAGAAVLPMIVLVPAVFVLAAWAINHLYTNLGYVVVAVYGLTSVLVGVFQYRKARVTLQKLRSRA